MLIKTEAHAILTSPTTYSYILNNWPFDKLLVRNFLSFRINLATLRFYRLLTFMFNRLS